MKIKKRGEKRINYNPQSTVLIHKKRTQDIQVKKLLFSGLEREQRPEKQFFVSEAQIPYLTSDLPRPRLNK